MTNEISRRHRISSYPNRPAVPGRTLLLTRFALGGPVGEGSGVVPPWIDDPSLEEPTHSEDRYLELERLRARVTSRDRPWEAGLWQAFFDGLHFFHERLGGKLVIVIIPDAFQVEDALWEQIRAQMGQTSSDQRDAPQRWILEFCADRAIPCLDLLPALRDAEPDGATYHLRNTHWNARGNAVAGKAIAEFLGDVVAARRPAAEHRSATHP